MLSLVNHSFLQFSTLLPQPVLSLSHRLSSHRSSTPFLTPLSHSSSHSSSKFSSLFLTPFLTPSLQRLSSRPQASRGLRYDIVVTVPLNVIKHRGYRDFQHRRATFLCSKARSVVSPQVSSLKPKPLLNSLLPLLRTFHFFKLHPPPFSRVLEHLSPTRLFLHRTSLYNQKSTVQLKTYHRVKGLPTLRGVFWPLEHHSPNLRGECLAIQAPRTPFFFPTTYYPHHLDPPVANRSGTQRSQ